MASFSTKDFVKALEAKGLDQSGAGSHHQYYILYHDGKKSDIQTYVSHSERDFGDSLISARRKQLKLTRDEFADFVKCPLTKEEYLRLLKERGHI